MNIYFPPKHWKPLKNDLNHGQVSEKNRNRKKPKLHAVLKGIQLKLTPNSHYISEGTLLLLAARKSIFFGPVNHSLQLLRCKGSADLRFSEFCDFQWWLQEDVCRSQNLVVPWGCLRYSDVSQVAPVSWLSQSASRHLLVTSCFWKGVRQLAPLKLKHISSYSSECTS